jgi:hypothetical protein
VSALRALLSDDTAGDPVSGVKWTRRTVRSIAKQLRARFDVSHETVRRLIYALGYRQRSNRKRLTRKQDPRRDRQIRLIKRKRLACMRAGKPVISVDTKHRELVGQFKNIGRTWRQEPLDVLDSDYPSYALGVAIPYGIYDVGLNQGFVVVGKSKQTPEFAVNSITLWWEQVGRIRYPSTCELFIEADGGNPNAANSHRFKFALQQFADRFGLAVTVYHYPTGASKWNPIEHRLFSQISSNWAGKPLTSYETVVNYISTTQTQSGLRCVAVLDERDYSVGIKLTDAQRKSIRLHRHRIHPDRNYTILPHAL